MNVLTLDTERQRVARDHELLKDKLSPWRELRKAEAARKRAATEHEEASRTRDRAMVALAAAQIRVGDGQGAVTKATHSFFFGRGGRVTKARAALEEARQMLLKAEASAGKAEATTIRKQSTLSAVLLFHCSMMSGMSFS